MSNPLVHGWNGDFHNSMFKKRFPSAATPALSSLAPTVGGVTAAGGRGGPEEEHKLWIRHSCLWPWDFEHTLRWLGG